MYRAILDGCAGGPRTAAGIFGGLHGDAVTSHTGGGLLFTED